MRLALRILKWIGLILTAAVLVLATHVYRTWDRVWDAPLPEVHASTDPAVIARGEYLAFGPAHCVECHTASSEVFERYADTGERPPLSGGFAFPAPPLGTIYSKNITPDPDTGIGRYSDGQIARMLRYAVKPDGRASIRPLMEYADMSDNDVAAIISFLRSQQPVRHVVPNAEWSLVGKIIKSLAPAFRPRTPDLVHAQKASPPPATTRERGEYLVRGVGNCSGCHSPLDQLTFSLNGPEFSGGAAIEPRGIPGVDHAMWFQPPNLTPLAGSALLRFPDRETFVARFQKGGRKYRGSPMPWDCYRNISAEDAGAVYEFLHSLPAAGQPSPQEPTVRHE
jgi:mono/diheme cytochrome c family protein